VFIADVERSVTRRIDAGWSPAISADGRHVAYLHNERGRVHVVVTDLGGTTRTITRSVRGGAANGSSAAPALSSDGRFVVFQSEASDLIQGEDFNLLWDVFVYDRSTDTMTRVSGDRDEAWMEPSVGPSIDARGSIVTFSSRHPTGAVDKGNDYDLYVAMIHAARH
jgi:Tol biopolymer transport system component